MATRKIIYTDVINEIVLNDTLSERMNENSLQQIHRERQTLIVSQMMSTNPN